MRSSIVVTSMRSSFVVLIYGIGMSVLEERASHLEGPQGKAFHWTGLNKNLLLANSCTALCLGTTLRRTMEHMAFWPTTGLWACQRPACKLMWLQCDEHSA